MADLSHEQCAALLQLPPYHQWLGVELVRVAAGEVELRLPFRPEFVGDPAGGTLHGGILAALADIAACFAVITVAGKDVPTADLRVDYLRPASAGQELRAVGRALRAGRTLGTADAEIRDATGRLLAVGRGTFPTGLG